MFQFNYLILKSQYNRPILLLTIGNVIFVCMRILFFPGVLKIVDRMKDWLETYNIPTEKVCEGVLKVVDKEEVVVVAKEVAGRIMGFSVLGDHICGIGTFSEKNSNIN